MTHAPTEPVVTCPNGQWRGEWLDGFAILLTKADESRIGSYRTEAEVSHQGTYVTTVAIDFLSAHSREDFVMTMAARNGTAPIAWEQRLDTFYHMIQEMKAHVTVSWPEMQPLPNLLPSVPALPAMILPPALRPWLEDIAERMQVPLEYVAIPALVAESAVVGRQMGIYPKQHDDWLVIPNLWGAIVGRSGFLKSPTLKEALRPLDRLAAGAIDAANAQEERNKITREVLDAQITGAKDAVKKASKEGKASEIEKHAARLATLQAEREDLTTRVRRFKTNDATTQKLGELLRDNPNGLLYFRDELSGWLSSLNHEGREGDREFFLETWNGDGSYTFDRIGRGSVHVRGLCLAIVGGIQPSKIAQYVYQACEGGLYDDGLLQRFQLLVWPEPETTFVNADRYPYKQERDRAYTIYERLLNLDPASLGATMGEYADVPALRFSAEAQEYFNAWRFELETRLRAGTIRSQAFESHLAKYRSLMPSLALLFHLIRKMEGWEGAAVELESAMQAATWCDFLEAHATKVYAGTLNRDLQGAHALAAKIQEGAIADKQSPRDVIRAQWSLLRTSEDVYGGLTRLETLGWVRIEDVPPSSPKGGRPTSIIRLHPTLIEKHKNHTTGGFGSAASGEE